MSESERVRERETERERDRERDREREKEREQNITFIFRRFETGLSTTKAKNTEQKLGSAPLIELQGRHDSLTRQQSKGDQYRVALSTEFSCLYNREEYL